MTVKIKQHSQLQSVKIKVLPAEWRRYLEI